jgi:hypothetical protein
MCQEASPEQRAVGIGGKLLHSVDYPEPTFRYGASRFCKHGRVHSPPAIGRPHEDAGDAAHSSVKDTARSGDLAAGQGWAGTGPRLT